MKCEEFIQKLKEEVSLAEWEAPSVRMRKYLKLAKMIKNTEIVNDKAETENLYLITYFKYENEGAFQYRFVEAKTQKEAEEKTKDYFSDFFGKDTQKEEKELLTFSHTSIDGTKKIVTIFSIEKVEKIQSVKRIIGVIK